MNLKKLYNNKTVLIFYLLICTTTLYSYALVDPNITLINNPVWTDFRNMMVNLGYHQRLLSTFIFVFLITALFAIHLLIVKTKIDAFKIAFWVGLITLFSYPFLSHDFLKYLFDAKIVTFYHKNPYISRPWDFAQDPWLRFLRWIHQPYRYGPLFLVILLIPSFLSFGKFILSFLFVKLIFFLFYLWGVYILKQMKREWAILFATHPLIIIEGLVNGHNDIIGVAFGIAGIYYLSKNKNLLARIFFLSSAAIKYITLPILFFGKKISSKINNAIFISLVISPFLFFFPFFTKLIEGEIQPWYFLALFIFLPYYPRLINNLNIFFFGLLLSYYPYISAGEWDVAWKVSLKQNIIFLSLLINVLYLIFFVKKK